MSIKFKNLVTFGCSLTKDNYFDTWANYLSAELSLPLLNKAERGAGYDYISDAIVQSVTTIDSPLCVIMWPTADRFDLWVNDAVPHLQDDIGYASWLDGDNPAFCTIDGTYNKTRGYCFNGAVPRGLKHLYYKYFYTQEFHINKAWKTIVLIQNYLKHNSIPYIMSNTYPLTSMIQYNYDSVMQSEQSFLDQIDTTYFVDDALSGGFMEYCKKHEFDMFNLHHPKTEAHKVYTNAKIMVKFNDLYNRSR
jgi:hypothetical protein